MVFFTVVATVKNFPSRCHRAATSHHSYVRLGYRAPAYLALTILITALSLFHLHGRGRRTLSTDASVTLVMRLRVVHGVTLNVQLGVYAHREEAFVLTSLLTTRGHKGKWLCWPVCLLHVYTWIEPRRVDIKNQFNSFREFNKFLINLCTWLSRNFTERSTVGSLSKAHNGSKVTRVMMRLGSGPSLMKWITSRISLYNYWPWLYNSVLKVTPSKARRPIRPVWRWWNIDRRRVRKCDREYGDKQQRRNTVKKEATSRRLDSKQSQIYTWYSCPSKICTRVINGFW